MNAPSSNLSNEIEEILNKLADADMSHYGDSRYIVAQARARLTTLFNKQIVEAEENVAEHFAEGVPAGFTVKSWLAVRRATFDEEGRPINNPTTLNQESEE